jgi:dihydrofolate reductase
MLTLYNVVSEDGFIADINGKEDFIPDNLWVNFLNICREYGSVIMGRKTYDTIQSYEKELLTSFEELPIQKIVITGNLHFSAKLGYVIVHSPQEAINIAPDSLVTSGPILNNFLLNAGFVGKVIFHVVPVSIGNGIKPFNQNLEMTMIPINKVSQIDGITIKEFITS